MRITRSHFPGLVGLALALSAMSCAMDAPPPEPVGAAASAAGNPCTVDSDCSSLDWCNQSTYTCTTKHVNGSTMPSDPGRVGTPLDGTCGVPAAQLVCKSGVCYGDGVGGRGLCGYPDRVGPCSPGNAGVVCRSGTCSLDLTCEPLGGCHLDLDCAGGDWCDESSDTCTAKFANGLRIPSDPAHVELTLDKSCTPAAAQLVCQSGVCDSNGALGTGLCGYAAGNGMCTPASAAVVCQSGACSADGTCLHPSGCNVDADCPASAWCTPASFTCVPRLPNGSPMPTVPGHQPPLTGMCTAAAGLAVCASGVCDTADNACGFASGDGPCTAADAGTVCRSGACSVDGTCEPAGGCNVDGDCPASTYCNAHLCAPKVANGSPVPTAPGHLPPLTGMCDPLAGLAACASGVCDTADNNCGFANGDGPCTAASGEAVCRSGVCDAADGKCGYASGDGPCTAASAGAVCRSGACSVNGACQPAGGCNVDADCPASAYCNAHLCAPKAANGSPVPTAPGHQPPLTGTCDLPAGLAACASGVCDTADNACGFANGDGSCTLANGGALCRSGVCDAADGKCGYANGDGPCTLANGGPLCRSGACSVDGTCEPAGGCNVDGDCPASTYCNAHLCVPRVANGSPVPTAPGHLPPLTGTCDPPAGLAACASGVCDTADDKCGFANGDGPCTEASGGAVCRSGVCDAADGKCGYASGDGPCTLASGGAVCRSATCATVGPNQGTCVACAMDGACGGATPACNTTSNTCVQCTGTSAAACTGATPMCDATSSTCAPCGGDLGSGAKNACSGMGAPFCFLAGPGQGQCGMCAMDADCQGHPSGNTCDATKGTCYQACRLDADCGASQWCDPPSEGGGGCLAQLANGTPLPKALASVATCTPSVGERVCTSGVCDPKDNACGLATGDGPCAAGAECRDLLCNPTTHTCGGCATDTDCPVGDFCGGNGACTPKLPTGSTCARAGQCLNDLCLDAVCNAVVASGNGLLCAAGETGSTGAGGAAGIFGLMLAAAGLARRARGRQGRALGR